MDIRNNELNDVIDCVVRIDLLLSLMLLLMMMIGGELNLLLNVNVYLEMRKDFEFSNSTSEKRNETGNICKKMFFV